ncbi:MAG TPA: hypothetical protein VEQ37_07400 [Actinomycetota bacterium]|nr:hypothetical protein [Actinomycetota bacterium]
MGGELPSPEDIGPAARRHPDVKFLVYHSGFEVGGTEGPYRNATKTARRQPADHDADPS